MKEGTSTVNTPEITAWQKVKASVIDAMPVALKTGWWLIKLIIPVSLAVTLLKFFGILAILSSFLTPLFSLIGLPGEAALVFLTSIFLNIYSAIAVISSLPFSGREVAILAVMCLIAHNLIVETAVQKKTGSKVWEMLAVRLGFSILAGFLLNLIMPNTLGHAIQQSSLADESSIQAVLAGWAKSSAYLSVKIIILVSLLMILQRLLQAFGILAILSNGFRPILKPFGLPGRTSFLFLVANVLGLAYGSAVMMEETAKGSLSREEADLLNYHVAISHSNLEDVLLFVAIGVPALWLLLPRLFLAAVTVWGARLFKYRTYKFD